MAAGRSRRARRRPAVTPRDKDKLALIGRELHDSLGQELTGISLMSRALAAKLVKRAAPETADALRIAKAARGAVEQVRALAAGLPPSKLSPEGLPSALRDMAARAQRLFGVTCVVRCPAKLPKLEERAIAHLARIAQESLTNAAKHGRAGRVVIDIGLRARELRLRISDDGVGLRPAQGGRGTGLKSMARRARILGGSFELRRGKRGGAVAACIYPLRRSPTN